MLLCPRYWTRLGIRQSSNTLYLHRHARSREQICEVVLEKVVDQCNTMLRSRRLRLLRLKPVHPQRGLITHPPCHGALVEDISGESHHMLVEV